MSEAESVDGQELQAAEEATASFETEPGRTTPLLLKPPRVSLDAETKTYAELHRPAREFESRAEYLEHELQVSNRW